MIMFLYMILGGVIETLSVISIAPFLAIAANPKWVHTQPVLNKYYTKFGFNNPQSFLLATGLLFIGFNIFSNSAKVFIMRKSVRHNWRLIYVTSTNLHKKYLSQPYPFFLNRNSADLFRFVYTEVNFVIHNFFVPLLSCVERSIIVILLIGVIIIQSPTIAAVAALTFGSIYAAISYGLRKRIKRYGVEAKKADAARFMFLKEGFEAFKITKLLGLESFFIDSYNQNARHSSRMHGNSQIINMAPRYFLDSIGVIGIVAMTLFCCFKSRKFR
jgi:ABC-type bacteriocin/lantibiotic exporter with double-glycine peptidase domain